MDKFVGRTSAVCYGLVINKEDIRQVLEKFSHQLQYVLCSDLAWTLS